MLSVVPERTGEDLDLLFGALADATRRGIIERLAVGEATVTELAAPFSISLPAISRHLKVLERASLITRSQQGRWRQRATLPDVARRRGDVALAAGAALGREIRPARRPPRSTHPTPR